MIKLSPFIYAILAFTFISLDLVLAEPVARKIRQPESARFNYIIVLNDGRAEDVAHARISLLSGSVRWPSVHESKVAYWIATGNRWTLMVADFRTRQVSVAWRQTPETAKLSYGLWSPSSAAWSPDGSFLVAAVPVGKILVKVTERFKGRLNPWMWSTKMAIGLVRITVKTRSVYNWVQPDEDTGGVGADNFDSVSWSEQGLLVVRSGRLWQFVPDPDHRWTLNNEYWDWSAFLVHTLPGTLTGQSGDQWPVGDADVSGSKDGKLAAVLSGDLGGHGPTNVLIFKSSADEPSLKPFLRISLNKNLSSLSCSPDGRYLAYVDSDQNAWMVDLSSKKRNPKLLVSGATFIAMY